MAEAIRLGRMTDTMEEGFIADVLIKVGDKIKSGDPLVEVETDKATMPYESFYSGTILHVAAKKGEPLPIGGLIAIIGKEGEDFSALLKDAPAPAAEKSVAREEVSKTTEVAQPQTTDHKPQTIVQPQTSSDGRVKASPLAKALAKEKGIDISQIAGTGEEGRIVKRDVENAKAKPAMAAFVGKEGFKDVRVSQMRKTIARRLSESMYGAPHFYLTIDVNMDRAMDMRAQLNAVLPAKVSFNDFVIKAVAHSLRQHPQVNCSWLGDNMRYYDHIHIGMAVAVDEGLVVPVIRFADGKSISQIGAEAKALAEKANSKKLTPQEMEGNTFTISNLGMLGIEEFTAIINPPDACILAVGAIRQEPAVINGEIKIANRMKLTLSCDHRAVDGAVGARFLQTLKQTLEEPVRMLV